MMAVLEEALVARGRVWGDHNALWRTMEFEYHHGCPANKRKGAPPLGASSAIPRRMPYPQLANWSHGHKYAID